MKQSILLPLFCGLTFILNARIIDEILGQKEIPIQSYRILPGYLEAIVINMEFGGSNVTSMMNKAQLKNANIIMVDLVYSDFPKGIDMNELNKNRIKSALETKTDLVSNENIKWRLLRQMGCTEEAQAKILFHGIVIYYLPEQNAALYEAEKDYYSLLPKNDSLKIENKIFKQFKDSTVVAAFRRNQSKWTNTTIVTDVTCSMSPYVSQIILWFLYKFNDKVETNITLFNDGDGKKNELKVIGSTGGIYTLKTKDYNELFKLFTTATSKGCSGDTQENGIEAILRTQESYPNTKEIIYIADNYAPLRDISLLEKVKIPVRVVLCGTQININQELMNLAKMTNGSIHTMEQDLYDLSKLAEGKIFEFNHKKFIIKNGNIELLKSS